MAKITINVKSTIVLFLLLLITISVAIDTSKDILVIRNNVKINRNSVEKFTNNTEGFIIDEELKKEVTDTLQGFPGGFLENKGQKDQAIFYYTTSSTMAAGFSTSEIRFSIVIPEQTQQETIEFRKETSTLRKMDYITISLEFLGSNKIIPVAEGATGAYSHYFIGSDESKWVTNNQYFTKIVYPNLYENIDLIYEIKDGQLKYEFLVYPGGDPEKIQLHWNGPISLELLDSGMKVKVDQNEIVERDSSANIYLIDKSPINYQSFNRRDPIEGAFNIIDLSTYGFKIPEYDPSKVLIIDPIIYTTYFGGSGLDVAYGITVDSTGRVFVTGKTMSTDFPVKNAYNDTGDGTTIADAFVFSLSSSGQFLYFSTYIGGSDIDVAYGIVADSSRNIYITGQTTSIDFPTTINAYNKTGDGDTSFSDVFVCKLSLDGSTLLNSTYVGGSKFDVGWGLAIDTARNVYVTGSTNSIDFPAVNAFNSTGDGDLNNEDVFVFKLSNSGDNLVYSTYVSGTEVDFGAAIAVDSEGNAYVTGSTQSTDFPTINAYEEIYNDLEDVFVFKLNSSGNGLLYSTYIGGNGNEMGRGIAVDSTGNAYVTGDTKSTDFPTVNAYDAVGDGTITYNDAFVFKLTGDGSDLIYSTYVGGNRYDYGWAITIDNEGNAFITGGTRSTDFPTVNAFNSTGDGNTDKSDAIVFKLAPDGDKLLYSTYIGGSDWDFGYDIEVDSINDVYITGETKSPDFPMKNAYNDTYVYSEAFVCKLLIPELLWSDTFLDLNNSVTNNTNWNWKPIKTNAESIGLWLNGVFKGAQTTTFSWALNFEGGANNITINAFYGESYNVKVKETFLITLDTIAPSITLKTLEDEGFYQGGTPIEIEIVGYFGEVYYYWDTGSFQAWPNNTFIFQLPMSEGKHSLNLKAADEAGNLQTTYFSFTTDNTAPTAEIIGVTAGIPQKFSGLQTITVNPSDTSPIDRVEFELSGSIVFTDSETPYGWAWDTEKFSNGEYYLKIYVYDVAGNKFVSDTFTIVIENQEEGTGIGMGEIIGLLGALVGLTGAIGSFFIILNKIRFRRIIHMYEEGMSIKEIAAKTKKSEQKIRSMLRKAKVDIGRDG